MQKIFVLLLFIACLSFAFATRDGNELAEEMIREIKDTKAYVKTVGNIIFYGFFTVCVVMLCR